MADAAVNVSQSLVAALNNYLAETMITQRNKLFELLPQYGWEVINIEDQLRGSIGRDWFVDELWEVESIWTPKGLKVWIIFLIDPQTPNLRERVKGQGVWAVKAGLRKPPESRIGDAEVYLSLNVGWEKRLPEFFSHLADLRKQGLEQTLS
ncbi:MAG TPA: hypothetical protein VJ810_05785 [Blastocatellia bacterium]|nr:hypothetical protein [Blastocatellia bacterium]